MIRLASMVLFIVIIFLSICVLSFILFYFMWECVCSVEFLFVVLHHSGGATNHHHHHRLFAKVFYCSPTLFFSSLFFFPHNSHFKCKRGASHRIASKSLCNVHIIFETVISLWFKAVKLRKYLKRNKEKNQEHKYWMCHTNDCLTLSERVSEWVSEWVNECENECERERTIKNSKEK